MAGSLYIFLALAAGTGMAMQIVMNAHLRTHLNSPMQATIISLLVSLIAALIYCLVAGDPMPSLEPLRQSPWWCWLGGLMGTFYLCSSVVVAPKLGVGLMLCLIIAAQVTAATIIDHWGLMGALVRPASIGRICGIGLIVAGVALVAATRE